MSLWRECGKCHDLWPLDAVKCATCNCLLVNVKPAPKKAA